MTARTISADDLETLARAAHEQIELPGPEGGWAVAVINGREYRARVGPVPEPPPLSPYAKIGEPRPFDGLPAAEPVEES